MKPQNPSAFPNDIHESMNDSEYKHKGMSLRDYFAAKSLCGIMGSGLATPTQQHQFDNIAEDAYRLADAMLKQREL